MDVELLNRRLKDYYGTSVLDGKPIFRLVFSDHELEFRKGIHGPFDYQETVKEVKKYGYIHHRWILEKLVFIGHQRELVNVSGYSYEPVYVFQDKNGNPLLVEWWAIEYVVKNLGLPRQKRTEQHDFEDMEARKTAEELDIYDRLSQEGAKSFESGSATFLDSTKRQYFEE